MRTQEDVFRLVAVAAFPFVFEAMEFHWQWRIHPDSPWALTLIKHIGRYTSNVAVMGYEGMANVWVLQASRFGS